MKNSNRIKYTSYPLALFLMLLLFWTQAARAVGLLPPGYYSAQPIASWSFEDTNAWTSDQGDAPISFTNISWSQLGNGSSLIVNSNAAAWLNFNVIDPTNGQTNLVLNAPGSIMFWFGRSAPATTGDDSRNNLEQVEVNSPLTGTNNNYIVRVTYKGTLKDNNGDTASGQWASIILSGNLATALPFEITGFY